LGYASDHLNSLHGETCANFIGADLTEDEVKSCWYNAWHKVCSDANIRETLIYSLEGALPPQTPPAGG
jgi:hypothetical protein